jgi:protein SCO1/2
MSMRARLILALAILVVGLPAAAAMMLMELSPHTTPAASEAQRLPKIAPAPGFTLTSQDGAQVSLAKLRGKVVAVTFIFTRCSATCPMLTPLMLLVQDRLGGDFGSKIAFVSITIDPEHDTPEMLKMYAQMYGADVAGWSFLTGTPPVVADLTRRYGVFAAKNENGDVDHSLLTSIVDQRGILRVQYLGVRFDPEEFRRDLVSLVKER